MPIKIPNELPAFETLTNENIFVMTETRAITQDIRPLRIILLNLMPTKIATETQFSRLLGNSPLQVELELVSTDSHKPKNVSEEHILAFYKTFDEIKDEKYDGMVITGAPVEQMDYENVEYWEELCKIMEWSKTHVHSTLHICWGAQAALYYHYGIPKIPLDRKLFGVFEHQTEVQNHLLFRGADDIFYVPHSRHTTVDRKDVENCSELKIIASSPDAGVYVAEHDGGKQFFVMGHPEYDPLSLKAEYDRDVAAGLPINIPKNYYPGDDPAKMPVVRWRTHANMLYSNWLNYFVYQTTPYDINTVGQPISFGV